MLSRGLVVVVCALTLLAGITQPTLYRNEGLRASLAAELLRGSSWLVPHLHGEPHLTKPPGMSILIAFCSFPVGEVTPVTARLPSVFAAAFFAMAFAWATARRFGTDAGWLAVTLLVACPLWLDRVPSAEIDLVQLAWVGGSLLCLIRAAENDSLLWWLAAMACMAGGLFTKWTAPIFFYLTAVPWLYRQQRLSQLWRPGHLLGVAGVLFLSLLWLLAVGSTVGPDLLWQTVSRETLLRFSPAHHPRPYPWDEWVTFPIGFLLGCLPCSLLLFTAFRPGFAQKWNPRQVAYLDLWRCCLVASLIFWTLAPGHRPRHVLPAQPAVAALAVMVLLSWRSIPTTERDHLFPHLVRGFLAFWLVVKFTFVLAVIPARQMDRRPLEGAEILKRWVPQEQTLHVCNLKDDGLLFHYGRAVRRTPVLDSGMSGTWYLLTQEEWMSNQKTTPVIAQLSDGQGASLVLIRLGP